MKVRADQEQRSSSSLPQALAPGAVHDRLKHGRADCRDCLTKRVENLEEFRQVGLPWLAGELEAGVDVDRRGVGHREIASEKVDEQLWRLAVDTAREQQLHARGQLASAAGVDGTVALDRELVA